MKNILCLFIVFCCVNVFCNSQQRVLIESVKLKDLNYNITLDSIAKVYEELAPQNCHFVKNDNNFECYNSFSRVLYSIDTKKINVFYFNKPIDTIDIINSIQDNFGLVKHSLLAFYTISDIYWGLKHLKYINKKEAVIKDSLLSAIENIIPKEFSYATIINTNKNIETQENGYEYSSMFTKEHNICPDCKIVDTLSINENVLFVNNFFSLNCMTVPIPMSLCDYNPQDAIAYYNKEDKMIAHIEISFDCGRIYLSNLENKKSISFQMREIKDMNDYLVWFADNTQSKLSPELERLVHRRIINDENYRIEEYKNKFSDNGLFFIR